MIPFNKPYLSGNELKYIQEAVQSGKISGNGHFTKLCQNFFTEKYGFRKCLLTTSCTDALEMAAILSDVKPGDEVIVPAYTFVSSALAFVRQGAVIVFADSLAFHPDMDTERLERLITEKTKVIVPVHYAGMACNMNKIMELADKYGLIVIEDAAQSIDSYYGEKPLGSIGNLSTFSFHETKNIISGEGGMLVINDEQFVHRAEIIWEKGTNRAEFFRGEVNKYGWVDTGSSFLPSEIIASFLYAQLENLNRIQDVRKERWAYYYEKLVPLAEKGYFTLPVIPENATNNAHMFYLVCNSLEDRTGVIQSLKEWGIMATFHYQSLHKSKFYVSKYTGEELPNADRFTNCLVRLPMYYELSKSDIDKVVECITRFFVK